MPDLGIPMSAEAVGTIALAIAALVNSIAYVMRRRADASAQLVHSLLGRVQLQDDRIVRLEARIAELEASLRLSEGRERALLDENESLRDAIDAGRVIPSNVRIGASRRENTGRHASLTQELLAERAHHDHHDGETP